MSLEPSSAPRPETQHGPNPTASYLRGAIKMTWREDEPRWSHNRPEGRSHPGPSPHPGPNPQRDLDSPLPLSMKPGSPHLPQEGKVGLLVTLLMESHPKPLPAQGS